MSLSRSGGGRGGSGSGGGGAASADGEQEEEEESESSSSSLPPTSLFQSPVDVELSTEETLEAFRNRWKQDLRQKAIPEENEEEGEGEGESETKTKAEEEDENKIVKKHPQLLTEAEKEERACSLFEEGVEFERDGQYFSAMQRYKRALQLVPDIERRVFDKKKGKAANAAGEQTAEVDANGNSNPLTTTRSGEEDNENQVANDVDGGDDEQVSDLQHKFDRLSVNSARLICQPDEDAMVTDCHISCLPMELLIHILKWVVSSDLDLKSLEDCALVCRGFFLAARSPDLWRLICQRTWGGPDVGGGAPALMLLEHHLPAAGGSSGRAGGAANNSVACWRRHFLGRPRVQLDGCYIARVTYVRPGEQGFQDEFYRPWHMVEYFRYVRFFSGGRLVMVTSADKPANVAKMLDSSNCTAFQGIMHGHYQIVNNHVICACRVQKVSDAGAHVGGVGDGTGSAGVARVGGRTRRRRGSVAAKETEVPEQEFHIDFEIKGKKYYQLHWARYQVFTFYKNNAASKHQNGADVDVANHPQFPPLRFAKVSSYYKDKHSESKLE